MKFNRKWFGTALAAVAVAALGVGGAALATSESPEISQHAEVDGENETDDRAEDEDADTPISDQDALERASQAALAWLETEHGVTGEVTDSEVGDEESYYEIEVSLEDGRQVDVQLDEQFNVVGLD